MAVATTSRTEEIRLIWTENQWLYMVTGFIGGILFCLLCQISINNLPELIVNLLPEAAGILVTVTVIDRLNRRRDERNAIKHLQEQLVRDASSIVNDVARNAVHQLRKRNWITGDKGLLVNENLEDADLQGANLMHANLQGCDLYAANLKNANLIGANLQGANLKSTQLQNSTLVSANLHGADLFGVNLQGANLLAISLEGENLNSANLQEAALEGANLQNITLQGANLQNAKLWDANLQGADLWGTDLRGAGLLAANLRGAKLWKANLARAQLTNANLRGASLLGANLEDTDFGNGESAAKFDETTRLPDGSYWRPETDLTRFTNPPPS